MLSLIQRKFMNKRVNITYSVELEAIPEHISDLISKVYKSLYLPLDDKFNDSLDMLKKDNEKEVLKILEEVRQDMFKIDCFSPLLLSSLSLLVDNP